MKKISVLLTMIFCALVAHAQDSAPDASWDADPLDVLEPKKEHEVVEPTVPEFKEIPESGSIPANPPPSGDVAAPAPHETAPAAPAVATPAAPAGNDPDFAKEAQFNRIYKKYNQQPTSVEAWEKAVGKRQSETYQVQKGNTLWDISTTFFGDPNFWPKIWSFNNGAIGNPHEIDPSMTIRFFAGDMNDAPTVELGQNKEEADKTVKAGAGTSAAAETAAAGLPQPKRKHTPVLQQLPGSLPSRRFGIYSDEKPNLKVEFTPRTVPTGFEYLGYYLTDGPIDGVGVVTATEMNLKSVGDFVYIYVRLDHPGSGNEYIVQKNFGNINDPSVKGRKANMVEIQGQIEILTPVNNQKNIYRALVKKSISPVEVGALLIPGKLPVIDPTAGAITSGTGARIIGGQDGTNRTMFGANSLIFLDAGAGKGFTEGATYGIYADEAVRNSQTDAVQNDRLIGTAKVVKSANGFATAYVTKSTDDILKGDYVGEIVKTAAVTAPAVEAAPAAPAHTEAPAKSSSDDLEKEFEMDAAPPAAAPSGSGTDDSDLQL